MSKCRGIRCVWSALVHQGTFEMVARPQKFTSSIKWILPALEVQQERQDSLPDTEKWTLLSRRGGRTRALLQLWWDPWCSSRVQTGMSGNFLTCLKGFKEPFGAQVGRWNFSRDATAENGLSSPCREILLVFLELRGFLSSYDWEFMDKLIGAQGVPVSTRVASYPSGFLSSRCRGRGPQLELRPETQGSSPGPTGISVFLWGVQRGVRPRLL